MTLYRHYVIRVIFVSLTTFSIASPVKYHFSYNLRSRSAFHHAAGSLLWSLLKVQSSDVPKTPLNCRILKLKWGKTVKAQMLMKWGHYVFTFVIREALASYSVTYMLISVLGTLILHCMQLHALWSKSLLVFICLFCVFVY